MSEPPGYPPPGGYPGAPPAYGPGPGKPPPNYLVWAILSTVLCCIPLGIVSIVFAAQVNGKWASGDAAGAQKASERAKLWAIVAAVLGLVGGVGVLAARG